MSRVEPQLREYFDAGVERITVDDVIAQAQVQQNRLEPLRIRRNLKPAWAAVGAFAVTILGLGGLAAGLTLTERITGEFGADAAEIVAADGGTFGIWLIAAFVAALAAAGVTWLIRRPTADNAKDTEDQQDQGKVMVMETIEDTGREVGTTKEPTKPNRWSTVVVAFLAIALVCAVAWMVFMMRPNSPTAAPSEIQQLMEDYTAAWNAYDADALEALVAPEYRFGEGLGDEGADFESIRKQLWPALQMADWQNTYGGPYYAVGGPNQWIVSYEGAAIKAPGMYSTGDQFQNGLVMITTIDGALLVEEHFVWTSTSG